MGIQCTYGGPQKILSMGFYCSELGTILQPLSSHYYFSIRLISYPMIEKNV